MERFVITQFGLENLQREEAPAPTPGSGEIVLEVRALSLNYRDLLVIKGLYNPSLKLPAVPLSDAAGVVAAVGPGVSRVRVGDAVMTHFIAPWIAGPYRLEYLAGTLGTPGPGVAAAQVALSAEAVVPVPQGYTFAQAATLPIAALTAWGSLRTVADVERGSTVLTLGTGGVAVFTLLLAKALGARVIITSSSDEKLARCRQLGADVTINYRTHPEWQDEVLAATGGAGVDVTVETGGPGTLDRSMKATRPGGTVALPGALTGRQGAVTTGLILVRRLHIAGIMVDSRSKFEELVRFIEEHHLVPVISHTLRFAELPDALRLMESGGHFGKIVLERR